MSGTVNALKKGYIIRDYEIVRELGAGGFGITYLGFDNKLDKPVAIKEYMPSDISARGEGTTIVPKSEKFKDDFKWGLDKFLEEARILARFDHPNIVKVFRYLEAHGTGYIVMEYLEGETLAARLKNQGAISYAELRETINPILAGLSVVHKKNLLHRDITPGNIITRTNGVPALIDFGAARMAIGARSQSIAAIVTPGYAPIEQYSTRDQQGPWTDIYALGAICYRAMTGEVPIDSTDRLRRDPHIPTLKRDDISEEYPEHFKAAVDAALAVDEADRPQSIVDWKAMIDGDAPVPDIATSETDATKGDEKKNSKTDTTNTTNSTNPPSIDEEKSSAKGWLIGLGSACVLAMLVGGVFVSGVLDPPAINSSTQDPVPEITTPVIEDTGPSAAELEEARQNQLDDSAFAGAQSEGLVRSYGTYYENWPNGRNVDEADDGAWASASSQNSAAAYNAYLNYFPNGQHAQQALNALTALEEAEQQRESEAETPSTYPELIGMLLDRVTEALEPSGFTQVGEHTISSLNDDASEDKFYYLQANVEYNIVGQCDGDCTDIDLTLYLNGTEVDKDTSVDDYPVVRVTPTSAANYKVTTLMYECSSQPCFYGHVVLRKN